MKQIEQLVVSLNIEGTTLKVGELVTDKKKIYFKYYPSFIETGLQISPFKMKLSTTILTVENTVFNGLFGVFNDSLPDGWGKLLLDRTLISKGVVLNKISVLDRLAYIGNSGMGALSYTPKLDIASNQNKPIVLDIIAKETQYVLKGTPTSVIEELYNLGGSSGGARPKIFVGYNVQANHLTHDINNLADDYEHWIVKFPSSTDLPDIANIEYAYYKMAIDAGLSMAESKLFTTDSGKQYFATKRFDRNYNERLHMHSASGLLHDNYRFSNLDYGHVMDTAFRLENHVGAYAKVLQLAAFNVYSHNRDDHSKNISFLMNKKGQWQLAPAYDLTFSFSSHGMHSTMVAGESQNPGRKELLELAKDFDVKNPELIIDNIQNTLSNWEDYAKDAGVSNSSKKLIAKTLNKIRD